MKRPHWTGPHETECSERSFCPMWGHLWANLGSAMKVPFGGARNSFELSCSNSGDPTVFSNHSDLTTIGTVGLALPCLTLIPYSSTLVRVAYIYWMFIYRILSERKMIWSMLKTTKQKPGNLTRKVTPPKKKRCNSEKYSAFFYGIKKYSVATPNEA